MCCCVLPYWLKEPGVYIIKTLLDENDFINFEMPSSTQSPYYTYRLMAALNLRRRGIQFCRALSSRFCKLLLVSLIKNRNFFRNKIELFIFII